MILLGLVHFCWGKKAMSNSVYEADYQAFEAVGIYIQFR